MHKIYKNYLKLFFLKFVFFKNSKNFELDSSSKPVYHE